MKLMIALALFLLLSPLAHATKDIGNGGDLCEDRIKIIRDDLVTWIQNGGADSLQMPTGADIKIYKSAMLLQLQNASVSCTADTQTIGGAEKTCVNFPGSADIPSHMICNFNRFQSTLETDQYTLIHHEYAGLAGFEVNSGSDSDYRISNQVSGYLTNQVVKKLSIKPKFPEATNRCTLLPKGHNDKNGAFCHVWGIMLDGVLYGAHPCVDSAELALGEMAKSPVCHSPSSRRGRCAVLARGTRDADSNFCQNWGLTFDGYLISDSPCYDSADLAYSAMMTAPACQ